MNLQKIKDPNYEKKRLETGVVQMNDDWTGYFLRGDQAMWLAHTAEMFEQMLESECPDFMNKNAFTMKLFLNQIKNMSGANHHLHPDAEK